MFRKLYFKSLSAARQIAALREKGTMLGTRLKNGRKAYLYLLKDFCAEVIFLNDDTELNPEKITTFDNVQEFNSYLEREFRASF
ncbi:MAG: hypothetical protein QY309_14215 [Cyclobacteriaceae bacterium]|jgi:hypothetical protein|nr:MAG: hypothetical protein QY309_14215 [Cyclobacteriaceae bacterium]